MIRKLYTYSIDDAILEVNPNKILSICYTTDKW